MEVKERRPYSSLSKSRRHKEGPYTGETLGPLSFVLLFPAQWHVKSAASCFWLTLHNVHRASCHRHGPPPGCVSVCLSFAPVCQHVYTPDFSQPGLSGDCKDSQGLCVPTQKSYSSSETLKAFDQHQDQTRLDLGIWPWGVLNLDQEGFNLLNRN